MLDHSKLYELSSDYFALDGNAVMKLSPLAAQQACTDAANSGLVVVRIEGGIWLNEKFQVRLDCIWDGNDPPMSKELAHANNRVAASFILEQSTFHNVFILTTAPITGYLHKTICAL